MPGVWRLPPFCESGDPRGRQNSVSFFFAPGYGTTSGGDPIPSEGFTFEMGTFSDGFEPTYENRASWHEYWITEDPASGVETGLVQAFSTWWSDAPFLYPEDDSFGAVGFDTWVRPNGGVSAGDSIYVWGYNSKDLSGIAEWILVTNPDWTFPTPTSWGELVLPEYYPSTTEVGTSAIVGSINHPDYPDDAFARQLQTASVGAVQGSLSGGESTTESDGGQLTFQVSTAESEAFSTSSELESTDGGVQTMESGSSGSFDGYCTPLEGDSWRLGLSSYEDWVKDYPIPSQERGYHDDPAGDGMPNLLKYVLGLDPTVASRRCAPRLIVKEFEGENYLALTFLRPKREIDARLLLDASSDLTNWTAQCGTTVLTNDYSADYEQVWMLDDVPFPQDSRRFLRLRVIPYSGGADPGLGWRLAERLLADEDPGLVIEDARYIGHLAASDCFSEGEAYGLGIDEGVVLTSGWAQDWTKRGTEISEGNGQPGDAQLTAWMDSEPMAYPWNYYSTNATILEIDFTPFHNRVTLRYLFGSDEYYEASDPKNDSVAIFLGRYVDYENGIVDWNPASQDDDGNIDGNIALLPLVENPDTNSRAVAVFNVGEVWGTGSESEQAHYMDWFVNNSAKASEHNPSNPDAPPHDVGYSGFTVPFDALAEVIPIIDNEPQKYVLRIVVADEGDSNFDATTFLKSGSFRSFDEEE